MKTYLDEYSAAIQFFVLVAGFVVLSIALVTK